MTEHEVENALLRDREVALGLAAPYEPSPDQAYHELFAMSWSLICPRLNRAAAAERRGDARA